MLARTLLFLWMTAWTVLALTWAPLVPSLAETTRVLYFHIPAAWVTVVALGWSMLQSVFYPRTRKLEHQDRRQKRR